MLIVGAEHPLAQREAVSVAETVAEQWIIRANDYQDAHAMVSVGLGLALAPQSAVMNHPPGVKILSLGDDVPARSVVLAQRRDRVRAPAESAFQSLLVEMGQRWIDSRPAPA